MRLILGLALASLIGCEQRDELYCDEDTACLSAGHSVCDLGGVCKASEYIANTCIRPDEVCWDGGIVDAGKYDASVSDAAADAGRVDASNVDAAILDANPDAVIDAKAPPDAPVDAKVCPVENDNTGPQTCSVCYEGPGDEPGCKQCQIWVKSSNPMLPDSVSIKQGECCRFDCCSNTTEGNPWPSCNT